LNSIRVGFLVSSISRLGGGVSEAVVKMATGLRPFGILPVIFIARDKFTDQARQRMPGIEVVAHDTLGLPIFNYIPKLLPEILSRDIDILHLHGIWQYPSVVGSTWRRRTGRPYVISPHGMLDEWILSRGRMKKFLAHHAYERRNLASATLFHAITSNEKEQIHRYVPNARIVVIPNSVEKDNSQNVHGKELSSAEFSDKRPFIIYLGRIHEKKNIEMAIDAWISLKDENKLREYRFLIAGWGEDSYVSIIKKKILTSGNHSRIEFLGPIFGQHKKNLLTNAKFILLPSHSEGMPMVILEAWSEGTPALMSQYCNLELGFQTGAAVDCGITHNSIRDALIYATTVSSDRWKEMSHAAQDLVTATFSTRVVAASWIETYSNLLNQKPKAANHRHRTNRIESQECKN
jgi:glycosyltransferase involved in cell wall biosynthesis